MIESTQDPLSRTDRSGEEDVGRSLADELLDELVPRDVDWRALVAGFPRLSLAVAAALGFWLGRTRGRAILGGLAGLAGDTVDESINELIGRDVV